MRYCRTWRVLPVMITLLATSATADPGPVVLWKNLSVGDTPEDVAAKLVGDSAFKSVKVRRSSDASKEPSLSVKYRADGIEVLDLILKFAPVFEQGRLRNIVLQSEPGCAHRAPEQFQKMAAILHEKYPASPVEFAVSDEDMVRKARREGTDESPAVAGRVFQGDDVTVVYRQTFTAEPAPPVGYVSNPRTAALMNLLANQYEYRARECDGTGDHRMTHTLIYMTNEEFEAMHKGILEKHDAEQRAATDNL